MKAEFVDFMGSDLSVVNAARVSLDNFHEVYVEGEDDRLISYLSRHNHWTPFAHTAITLRVGAPVPIRTQCFKHKAGFVENEESRRYISSRPVLFVPDEFRSKPDKSIKQGSGGTHYRSAKWKHRYVTECEHMISLYEEAIEDGVAPEQARFFLPQGVEVHWIWTGNLASYARFYGLRTDPHAQREVQDLAVQIGSLIEPLFPVSWKALTNG